MADEIQIVDPETVHPQPVPPIWGVDVGSEVPILPDLTTHISRRCNEVISCLFWTSIGVLGRLELESMAKI